ncbi:MAG TPA: type II secretion system protein [Solirubrobacterales bacterium]|nr:type II secretion system protein [Solirubrobacterales bacterium]
MTLIEMLVAAMMSVIIVAASCAMLINSVRDQPVLSKKAQNVTTARYQLERIVREVRNGVQVEPSPTASSVTLVARVRRVACGGAAQTDPSAEPVQCKIVYSCSGSTCTRTELTSAGTPAGSSIAASGIGSTEVFCFVPSANEDPTECGDAEEGVPPTYIGVNLEVPSPEGPGLLTISDGATLRSAALNEAFGASS